MAVLSIEFAKVLQHFVIERGELGQLGADLAEFVVDGVRVFASSGDALVVF